MTTAQTSERRCDVAVYIRGPLDSRPVYCDKPAIEFDKQGYAYCQPHTFLIGWNDVAKREEVER